MAVVVAVVAVIVVVIVIVVALIRGWRITLTLLTFILWLNSRLLLFQVYFVYMAARGPTNTVPNPIPTDDDGYVNAIPNRTFPAGWVG